LYVFLVITGWNQWACSDFFSMAAIVLSRGSGVQGHGGASLLLGDVRRLQEGLVLVIDAHTDLCGDGDPGRRADGDHPMDQFGEEVGLPGQG